MGMCVGDDDINEVSEVGEGHGDREKRGGSEEEW